MKRRIRVSYAGMGALTGVLLVGTAFFAGRSWGPGAQWAAGVYAALVTLFLGAQIVGFVLTQVRYVEAVEQAKFKVLEVEGLMPEPSREK